MAHYMVCQATATQLEVSTSPSARLGIWMQWLDLRLIAIAYHIYHTCKFSLEVYTYRIHTYKQGDQVLMQACEAARIAVTEHLAQ